MGTSLLVYFSTVERDFHIGFDLASQRLREAFRAASALCVAALLRCASSRFCVGIQRMHVMFSLSRCRPTHIRIHLTLVDHIYIYIYIYMQGLNRGCHQDFHEKHVESQCNTTSSSPRVPPASSDVDDGGATCNFRQGAVAWQSGPPSGGGPPQIEEALRWRSRFEVRSWVLDGRGRCSPGRRTAAKMSVPNHATI